jgi:hypothetical protein
LVLTSPEGAAAAATATSTSVATGGLLKLRFRCPLSLALAWMKPEGAAAAATATSTSARDWRRGGYAASAAFARFGVDLARGSRRSGDRDIDEHSQLAGC